MATDSPFTALPDDVLSRVLLGVALDDHFATAAACRAFCDIIRGPQFPALRQRFGGFAAPELAKRIDDAKPRLLLTASCGIEGQRLVAYKPIVDQALELAVHGVDGHSDLIHLRQRAAV